MSCLVSPVFPLKSCVMLMALQAPDDESIWFAFFTVHELTKIIGPSPAQRSLVTAALQRCIA